ncbi:nuclear transport factor 2 family protein [Motiliproteus sp. SC1-56]|uniref:nuclear transport factor 2 family protein n=1 Tax=Motiliproteus sp. SC1-56 TaxID=2799565 RepID=UPI001A8C33F5|nr:nuclear transport factor 2 family protein [Motiliproteus sp. SC1-56]
MANDSQRAGLEAYIKLFNRLEQGCEGLEACVTEDVHFSDPFHQLEGRQPLADYLAFFARQVETPRFRIRYRGWDGDVCLLRWQFSGQLRGQPWSFPGVSELHFTEDGKVRAHIDHWDAASHFYQRLPLLGSLIRLIARRLKP